MTSQFEFQQLIEEVFEERFADYINTVDRALKIDPETDEPIEPPTYWEDDLIEILDGCMPVYNGEVVELWTDMGGHEPEEDLLQEHDTIIRRMTVSIWEQGFTYISELANEYGF